MTEREAKAFLNNLKVCIEEHPIVADWLVEIADRKTENSSENPNNCEHITEDGVTCAKYPACDDCLDNPLNKVKGFERLVKGSEKPSNCEDWQDWKDRMWAEAIVTEPTISKMEQVDEDINVRSKDEPQMNPCDGCVCDDGKHLMYCMNCKGIAWKTEPPKVEDEPQTERSE